MHPFAPADQTAGYQAICRELEAALAEITGFAAVSLQPNSGAQGELAGLLVIRAWHRDRGQSHRDVVLIPASAHGTNPASAVMAGYRVVVVASDAAGNIDVDDLKAKAAAARRRAGGADGHLSVHARRVRRRHPRHLRHRARARRPGLHGRRQHERAGRPHQPGAHRRRRLPPQPAQDVRDSARRRRPGHGADRAWRRTWRRICRDTRWCRPAATRRSPPVSAAPWGSASILLISYGYIRMLGGRGVTEATKYAILNANYIKSRLEDHYDVLYTRPNGRVAHEMIFDLRKFKAAGRGGGRRRQAADGLRVPRADGVVPGARHADGRAHRERAEGRARSLLRRADRHPRARSTRWSAAPPTRRTTC